MMTPSPSPTPDRNVTGLEYLQSVAYANRYRLVFGVYCLLGLVGGVFLQAFAAEALVELSWNVKLSSRWHLLWPVSLTILPALIVTIVLRHVATRWFTRHTVRLVTAMLLLGFLALFWLNSNHLYPSLLVPL